jgi:hypothetical protein
LDVDNDGFISPIDVLLIINRLNSQGAGPLPTPTPGFQPPPYYDTNGDGQLSPIDALLVVNFVNSGEAQPEGEGFSAQADVFRVVGGESFAAAAGLVSEFSPGYRESRYAATSPMPPALYDELTAPWSAVDRFDSVLLVKNDTDRYRDEIHASRTEVYRASADLDDVLADLAWDQATDDELSGHDQLADAALTDLLEQDLLGGGF